jgi:hypothetical protein
MRTTAELRCPFLDCRSKKVAAVVYDSPATSAGKIGEGFDERLFQCQKCKRRFLYLGDLPLNNNNQ